MVFPMPIALDISAGRQYAFKMSVYQSFAVTKTGGSHKKHGIDCQDASRKDDGKDSSVSIAVVADGHGERNCFRSGKGAEFAAACAVTVIEKFVKFHESEKSSPSRIHFDKAIRNLAEHIIGLWQVIVSDDHSEHPFSQEELAKADDIHRIKFKSGDDIIEAYGTTLITAAITDYYWFGIHVGDGRLTALYPDGSFDQPVPWDKRCCKNVTTSICDGDADKTARIYFSFHHEKAPPAAVFLCSDGVDDNFPADGNEKHLFELYRKIALAFAEDGFDAACKQLNETAASFAANGKSDDTSIAGFIDIEAAKKAAEIWKQQTD